MLVAEFTQWSIATTDIHPANERENPKTSDTSRNHFVKMFGILPVASFGFTKLIALRDGWNKKSLARHTINAMTRRTRQVFR
jgi:hypothetical protein